MLWPHIAAACFLFVAAGVLANTTDFVTVNSVRTGSYSDHVRVVLDLSGPAVYQTATLDNPPRLVLAVERARLGAPIDQQGFKGTALLSASDSTADGTDLQIVFNLSGMVTAESFPLKPHLDRGDRIVLDIYEVAPTQSPPQVATATPVTTAAASQHELRRPNQRGPRPEPKRQAPRQATSPVEFSGTWTQELAVATNDSSIQKFEAVVEPRFDFALPADLRLTAIARLRADSEDNLGPDASRPENYSAINGPWYNDAHGEFSLREFYVDATLGTSFWRVGKQQVVWGQADGIKVMDVVNPQSYREFIMDDLDDSRIPLWMVNAELPVTDNGSLQLLWIPDTTYHELAEQGTPYAFTSTRLVPVAPAGLRTEIHEAERPDNALSDSDAGLRYATFLGGWDLTLNYLYQYQNFPVPYQYLRFDDAGFTGVVEPEYERNHLMGGTASNVFGDVTLRAEAVYNSDTYHMSSNLSEHGIAESDEFASVIGLDWQLGQYNTLLSTQWFQRHLFEYNSDLKVDQTEHNISMLYRRTFSNETWYFDALGLYSPNHGDRWVQLNLNYMLRSNLELWLGGDFFGGDREGVYGEFRGEDRVLIGFEYGL